MIVRTEDPRKKRGLFYDIRTVGDWWGDVRPYKVQCMMSDIKAWVGAVSLCWSIQISCYTSSSNDKKMFRRKAEVTPDIPNYFYQLLVIVFICVII